jgi:hypothetical protein
LRPLEQPVDGADDHVGVVHVLYLAEEFADFLGFLQPPEELSLARGSPDQLMEAGPYAQTLRNPREA